MRGSKSGDTKKHAQKERARTIQRKKINEMKAWELSDTEFITTIVRMLKEFRGEMDELSEKFNKVVSVKDIETIEKNQWEMKNTVKSK